MNPIARRLAAILYRLHILHDHEHPFKLDLPFPRAIALALFACFTTLAFSFCAVRPLVKPLEVGCVDWLMYAGLPLAVTMITLARAGWHRELSGGVRAGWLLWQALVIWGGLLLAIAILIVVVLYGTTLMPKASGSSQ